MNDDDKQKLHALYLDWDEKSKAAHELNQRYEPGPNGTPGQMIDDATYEEIARLQQVAEEAWHAYYEESRRQRGIPNEPGP
jgi:hypothetical protein